MKANQPRQMTILDYIYCAVLLGGTATALLVVWGLLTAVWGAEPPKQLVKHEPVTEELMRQYVKYGDSKPIMNYFVYDRLAGKRYYQTCKAHPTTRDPYCAYEYNTSGAVD